MIITDGRINVKNSRNKVNINIIKKIQKKYQNYIDEMMRCYVILLILVVDN